MCGSVLDLFCGAAGGWSLGMHRAGYRTVAACEIDPWRRAVFLANNPGVVMYDDVRTLTADRIRSDLGYLPDILVGSPPCQQISAANAKGTGITDDHLFWDWARLVFEIRPVWCGAENSPRARTEGIDGILDALDQAGYASWCSVVGVDHAGANHERRRLWLIAADTERHELWQQPGRGGGTRWAGAPVSLIDDPNADGELREAGSASRRPPGQGRGDPRRSHAGNDSHADAYQRRGAEPYARDDRNAQSVRCGKSQPGPEPIGTDASCRCDGYANQEYFAARVDPQATARASDQEARERDEGQEEPRRPARGRHSRFPSDTDGARHALGSSFERDDGEELPSALRDIGLAWSHWNRGIAGLAASCAAAGFGGMDDGLPAGLAPGPRNRCIAAYGDAICPDIAEAIGRSMFSASPSTKRLRDIAICCRGKGE